jgi:hypothetical protein
VARGKPRYGAYGNRKRPRRAGAARAPFRAWGVALAFMWLRPDPAVVAAPTTEPQPAAGATTVDATTPAAARPGYDWVIMGLEVVSACVAVLSLVQQVLSS